MILGVDPGREKCGLAVVALDRRVHFRAVVTSRSLLDQIDELLVQFPISTLVLGNQTTFKYWQAQLQGRFVHLRIVPVDERHSSEQARGRYWQFHPPRGLARLLPASLRMPPEPYDDVVALILVERYLESLVAAEGF